MIKFFSKKKHWHPQYTVGDRLLDFAASIAVIWMFCLFGYFIITIIVELLKNA